MDLVKINMTRNTERCSSLRAGKASGFGEPLHRVSYPQSAPHNILHPATSSTETHFHLQVHLGALRSPLNHMLLRQRARNVKSPPYPPTTCSRKLQSGNGLHKPENDGISNRISIYSHLFSQDVGSRLSKFFSADANRRSRR